MIESANTLNDSKDPPVIALKKLNASDDEIAAYSKEISDLHFSYKSFEHSSIVFVITSIKGVKKRFFNKNLTNVISQTKAGLNINPNEILTIAKQMYQIADDKVQASDLGEVPDEVDA